MKSIEEINIENISYKKPLKVDKGNIHYLKYDNKPLIIRTKVLNIIDKVDDNLILDLDEETKKFINELEYKIVDNCRQNHSIWGIKKQRYKSIIKELDNEKQVIKVNISGTRVFDANNKPIDEFSGLFVELILELEGVFISENLITLLIKCYQGKVIDSEEFDTEYSNNPLSLPEEYSSSIEFY